MLDLEKLEFLAKAFYLIKFYNLDPNEILLLTFNKKAAEELGNRLKAILKLKSFHTARTFSSIAYQIRKPEVEIEMSYTDVAADKMTQSIQNILNRLWRKILLKTYILFSQGSSRL